MAKRQRKYMRAAYLRMKRAVRLYFPERKLLFNACAVNAPACHAALTIDGTLFVNNTEPKLPLAGCDARECICSYIVVDARRLH